MTPPPLPARGAGWPAPPPPGPRMQTGRASHAWPADMQSRGESHRAPPRRPVSLKIGPQIKSNPPSKAPTPPPLGGLRPKVSGGVSWHPDPSSHPPPWTNQMEGSREVPTTYNAHACSGALGILQDGCRLDSGCKIRLLDLLCSGIFYPIAAPEASCNSIRMVCFVVVSRGSFALTWSCTWPNATRNRRYSMGGVASPMGFVAVLERRGICKTFPSYLTICTPSNSWEYDSGRVIWTHSIRLLPRESVRLECRTFTLPRS